MPHIGCRLRHESEYKDEDRRRTKDVSHCPMALRKIGTTKQLI